jgi:PAS domain S-box-containing protein
MRPLMTLWHQQERVRPVWITLALLAVATAIRMALTLVWGTGYAFLTYYPVIMLSTLVGGWQQGVIATALATLLSYSLFFDHPLPVGEVVVLAMFVSVNLLMVTAAESLLRARRKAEQVSLVAEFREHEVRRQLEDREKTEANLRNMRLAALNLMEDAIEARNTSEESATFLRESEERLRLALSAARLAAWDWNIQTDEVIWNDEHFLMLGYPVGSVTPSYQAWASRVHVEDLDTAEAGIRRSMATGEKYAAQYRVVWPDGTLRWIETRGEFYFDPHGRPLRNYGVMLDISDRLMADQQIRENEARLRLALEAANAGFWDREISTGKVLFSDTWKRQLGYADDELPNSWQIWEDHLHPADRQRVLQVLQDFIGERASTLDLEYRLRHKDGSSRWIHSRGALLRDEKGMAYRILGLNLDITEHKKAEGLRDRRGKLEQLSRLHIATQTAAAVAHELHQPLAAITSYTEAAQMQLHTDNQNLDKLDQVLKKTALQAERAGLVTRQLLALLQKSEVSTESVSLGEAVLDAVELIKSEQDLAGIEVRVTIDPDLPQVQANRLQIEKVLIVLLHNAVEAMRNENEQGAIHVVTGMSKGTKPMVQVSVRDSGKQLDATVFKKIFKPFYTTKPTGIGMGLTISRSLIEMHGGKLWAEQNPDRGLTFHFTLPCTQ